MPCPPPRRQPRETRPKAIQRCTQVPIPAVARRKLLCPDPRMAKRRPTHHKTAKVSDRKGAQNPQHHPSGGSCNTGSDPLRRKQGGRDSGQSQHSSPRSPGASTSKTPTAARGQLLGPQTHYMGYTRVTNRLHGKTQEARPLS